MKTVNAQFRTFRVFPTIVAKFKCIMNESFAPIGGNHRL
jgi:hypothetical protein